MDGFDFSELTDYSKKMLSTAQSLKNGKETKKLLNKEGGKLATQQKKSFNSKGIGTGGEDSTRVAKSFKKGKVYNYDGAQAIRGFSSDPLTHLLNDGHRIVTKGGEEKGFVVGYKFMDDAEEKFQNVYYEDIDKFLDDLLDKGLL